MGRSVAKLRNAMPITISMPREDFRESLMSLATNAPRRSSVAVLLLVVALSGCGSKDPFPLAPVHGTVTYQGKPVERGRVVFVPAKGTPGPQAVGRIGLDGSFRMTTANRDGAAVGQHVVTVHCRREPTAEEARNLVIPESLIPLHYAREDTSPLNLQVQDGQNELPINLE
jgi:predicted small lipoprotein YifL